MGMACPVAYAYGYIKWMYFSATHSVPRISQNRTQYFYALPFSWHLTTVMDISDSVISIRFADGNASTVHKCSFSRQ